MKGRILFISVLLMAGALSVSASPAAAKDDSATQPLQLSLGDSWAAGAGAPPGEGYVPQLHEALKEDFNCSGAGPVPAEAGCPQLQLANVAVGGATTPSMIESQFPDALPLLEERNGNLNPRDDVELVTLHIGGNDVTGPILLACAGGATPACFQVIQAELAAYAGDLDVALATLREAAGDAPIVIGTYDNGFANCNLGATIPGASS
jgi:phospholipase/lecithinase/hemolysin